MPTFADVVLQLQCDGIDGSTTFTDISTSGLTVTAVGNAQVDTAQSKWGGGSLLLDGTGDYLTIPSSAVFGFGAGAWTAEAWVRPSSFGVDRQIFDFRPGISGAHALFYLSTTGRLTYFDGTTVRGNSGTAATVNVWQHIAWCYDGTTLRAYLNGVQQWSATFTPNFSTARPLVIGANFAGTGVYAGHIDDVRVTAAAWYTANFTPPDEPFFDGVVECVVSENSGPLGAVAIIGAHLVSGISSDGGVLGLALALVGACYARTAAGTMLGAALLRGHTLNGRSAAASMLSDASTILAAHDFTSQVDPAATIVYVMDLVTPGGLVRVPISSWQATLQTDVQSYVQCVVPAATNWVPDIEAATEFVIMRRGELVDGSVIEYEMARAPAQTVSLDGGAYNYTATISGYSPALEAVENPPEALDRTLDGVRTVSRNSGNVRVRCSIDWLLRPGQRAYLNEEAIVVAFVNYYVPGFDQYMDVGTRA